MTRKLSLCALSCAVSLASGQSVGNGFALNEQSISGMGTAYAGRASSALDATTVYGNPAGMSRLDKEQISGGFVYIIPNVNVDNDSASNAFGPVTGKMSSDIARSIPVPFGYYVNPLDERWSFGFGVYSPYGQGVGYGHESTARYLSEKTDLKMITFQPTLSYKVTDDLSVGLGLTANYANVTLVSALPVTEGKIEAKGDDWGYGYNFGLLYQLTDRTRVGMTYHSKVNLDLNMQSKVRNLFPLLGPANENIDGSLKGSTPESVDFSLTHELNDDWTFYAGTTWTRWSRWQDITINNTNSPTPIFDVIRQDLHWHDTWAYSLGASYRLNPQWVLRAGLALDESPAGNTTQNARLPVADRKILTLGAGWKVDENWSVDFVYSYLRQDSFNLRQQDSTGNTFQADYKIQAQGLGIQLNYLF